MKVVTKELTPSLWEDLETLFGGNGACGGCWCMSWRIEKGEHWNEIKGETAKKRQEALVKSGRAHGILAYVDEKIVGWCSFGKRTHRT